MRRIHESEEFERASDSYYSMNESLKSMYKDMSILDQCLRTFDEALGDIASHDSPIEDMDYWSKRFNQAKRQFNLNHKRFNQASGTLVDYLKTV